MRQLSHLLALSFILFHLNSRAQSNIRQDWRIDPLLRAVAAKRPGLIMFARNDDRGKYVNMAVLSDSTQALTWFTCYGQAFETLKLSGDVYNRIKSYNLNPFDYYKDYSFSLLSLVRDAAAQFRQKGETALRDTGNIYHGVYTYPPVQQARSMLQKEVAIERVMSNLYLKHTLFDTRIPQQLPSDSFQHRLQLAGRMVRKKDTTTYYNTNLLSSATKIVLYKQAPGKMFVYNLKGQLTDSVPLKADKFATLLNEKEDVFLLYRGWLELQSEQAIAKKEEIIRLQNKTSTMLSQPVYWKEDEHGLQQTLSAVQAQIEATGNKIMGLIVFPQEETAQLLATISQDKPVRISYLPGLGFAYASVYHRGDKRYELTDQRGNVMTVVSDQKKEVDENEDGLVEYYHPDVVSAVDYGPFGGQMVGRAYSGEDKYRYGFNGKENDNEIKGEGSQQDYGMRIYDPRVGKFLSMDPLTKDYPELTPYQFASNRPIDGIDLDGKEHMKAPNPKATALLIVGTNTNEVCGFAGFYKAAMSNNNIDVMKAGTIQDVNKYLSERSNVYQNIIIADHGAAWQSSGQVLTNLPTAKSTTTYYRENDLYNNIDDFQKFSNYIAPEGNLVLLGCFTAAAQLKGESYLKAFSQIVDRPVYGNQGESSIRYIFAFTGLPMGISPMIKTKDNQLYFDMAVQNAGKWSLAKPSGKIELNIGNLGLNAKGEPSVLPPLSPVKPVDKPFPSFQTILNNANAQNNTDSH